MNAQLTAMTDDDYEELITKAWGKVKIGILRFDTGKILRDLDPVAFRCYKTDEPEKWQCEKCDSMYETEEEAEECCKK